ncbi:hypothetical protein SISNIDRAFT_468502 [Sistotremastrum niveocremeum HHB9708]|uniref:Uncharacterized protein n=1 Tax=Sistotremastrum niveocremeum HHB9708 TaxID=1314777 RepID=A0A164RBR9_9AGAM|nr:hypothetical protein SISNIDRAFT_468502 [Sistotremastrum niveocremeum HHB9708]
MEIEVVWQAYILNLHISSEATSSRSEYHPRSKTILLEELSGHQLDINGVTHSHCQSRDAFRKMIICWLTDISDEEQRLGSFDNEAGKPLSELSSGRRRRLQAASPVQETVCGHRVRRGGSDGVIISSIGQNFHSRRSTGTGTTSSNLDPEILREIEPPSMTRRPQQRPNSRLVALSFPNEIISNILECSLQDALISIGKPLDARRTLRDILDVTHVCNRWREVAVADSRLWSTIVLSWPEEAIEEFITRSNGARLRFILNMSSCEDDCYADATVSVTKLKRLGKLIFENMTKIRSLELALSASEAELASESDDDDADQTDFLLSEIFSPFLHSEAPSLERFTLSTECEAEHSTFAVENLFQNNALNLRHIKLHGNNIRLTKVSFPLLTTLHFEVSGVNGVLYRLMDIPALLSQFPCLKSLSLEHHSERLSAEEILAFRSLTNSPHFVLPTINFIKLDGLSGNELEQFLSRLELPAIETLITCPPRQSSDEIAPIPLFPPWMHTFFKDVSALNLCFNHLGIRIEFPMKIKKPKKLFSWQIHHTSESIGMCLNWCIPNFQLLNPETLRITRAPDNVNCYEPHCGKWRDVLSCFPSLIAIVVEDKIRILSLIKALTVTEFVCPALRELDIRGAPSKGVRKDDIEELGASRRASRKAIRMKW